MLAVLPVQLRFSANTASARDGFRSLYCAPMADTLLFVKAGANWGKGKQGGELRCAFLRWHYPDQVRRVSLTRKRTSRTP